MFSQAQEVAHYLDQRKRQRRVFSIVYLALLAGYVAWRATIFNPHQLAFSALFYVADVLCAIQGCFFIWTSWDVRRREPAPADYRPTVDVFLPVYTEPAEMIELTVIGAIGIAYPHRTFLLDDGRRPELREIAERHGAIYVTRPDNKGAKAGNMNHALKLSTAEVVAVFDADHIPKRESLDMLVGHLKDPRVAVSHAPQMYYNEDGFLYRDVVVGCGRWHEQAHFMNVVQSNRDLFGGSTCVGTGCAYSRKALDAIGGFPEATLTEDYHSSILFHKHGYETVWVNEPVAWGVAAADVSEYYKTRRRWTYGNLQAFALEKVLWGPGLPWRHRLGYISSVVDLLAGWFQIAYVLVPLISMLFYITPFQPGALNTLLLLLFPTLLVISGRLACGGYVRFLPGQVFSMGKMFMQVECTRGLFGRKMQWQISLKNVLGSIHYGKLLAHILMLVASFVAILYCVLRLMEVIPSPSPPAGGAALMAVAMVWVLLNCWRSWRWITDSVRLTLRTHREYMFEARVPVLDESGAWVGSTTRLSTMQLEVQWHAGAKQPACGDILLLLIPGHTVRVIVQEQATARLTEVTPASPQDKELLRRSLYSVDWHRMLKLAPHSHMARERGLSGHWEPAVLMQEAEDGTSTPRWAHQLRGAGVDDTRRLLVEGQNLAPGTQGDLLMHEDGATVLKKCLILRSSTPLYAMPEGLNLNKFNFFEFGLM